MTREFDLFKGSINVFRAIRQYTESFDKEKMSVTDLYEIMGNLIHNRLHIDVAIYRENEGNQFRSVYASPQHEYLPQIVHVIGESLQEVSSFQSNWWFIPFGKTQTYNGYVALRVILTSRDAVPLGSLFINNEKDEDPSDVSSKDYFVDLIVTIIEHFESALTQIIITERNTELINELRQQNEALIRAREENKVSLRQGREWVSVMSHEIRTPLFAINSLSELLLDKFTPEDSEVFTSLELIVKSGKHLSELINNILDFTKLEADQLQLEHIDFEIRTLINDCVALNVRNDQRLYPHTCIFIGEHVPKVVIGDQLRVKQIMMNLVNNAVKFTPDDGIVHIHVDTHLEMFNDRRMVRLTVDVYDTGIGVKPDEKDKIFKPFSQTDASITRKFGGSGLGLSICKKMCQLMNGDISFEDNTVDGRGTKFTFNILLDVEENYEEKKITDLSTEIPKEVREWRFLIVDDSDTSRLCTRKHLEHFGIRNVTTQDILPDIEMEKSGEDYDVYLINTRAKSVIENIDLLKKKVNEQQDRVMLQNYPYAKKMLDLSIPIMAEIYGPITERELKFALITLAERRNLINPSDRKENKLSPLKGHILVAEDNIINQNVIKKMLEKFGVTAEFADNGQVALELFQRNPQYKVILMDIMMPVMDGYTASTEIRKHCRNNKVPYIVALTANAFWEDRLRAMQSGMNAFLTKPVKLADLHATLAKGLDVTEPLGSIQEIR